MAKKTKKNKPKKKMSTVRNENLRTHLGDGEFVGIITGFDKKAYYDKDNEYEYINFLISPLYIKVDNEWVFIDHAWVRLKRYYTNLVGKVFHFEGVVKTYQSGFMVAYKKELYVGPNKNLYPTITRWASPHAPKWMDTQRARELNKNYAIIGAFETGVPLPQRVDRSEVKKGVAHWEKRKSGKRRNKKSFN